MRNNKKYPAFLALLALILASLACGFNIGSTEGVSLENLRMALDEDGNNPTTVFTTSDVFYAVGDLKNAPAGTVVEANWLAVQIEGFEPDELIYEQTISDFTEESFTGPIYFQLSNDNAWSAGEYKVDIYLDGNLVNSLSFSVQ